VFSTGSAEPVQKLAQRKSTARAVAGLVIRYRMSLSGWSIAASNPFNQANNAPPNQLERGTIMSGIWWTSAGENSRATRLTRLFTSPIPMTHIPMRQPKWSSPELPTGIQMTESKS
jgi:hypothetical protein